MSYRSEMEPAEGSRETVDKALNEDREQRVEQEESEYGIPADQTPEEIQEK